MLRFVKARAYALSSVASNSKYGPADLPSAWKKPVADRSVTSAAAMRHVRQNVGGAVRCGKWLRQYAYEISPEEAAASPNKFTGNIVTELKMPC